MKQCYRARGQKVANYIIWNAPGKCVFHFEGCLTCKQSIISAMSRAWLRFFLRCFRIIHLSFLTKDEFVRNDLALKKWYVIAIQISDCFGQCSRNLPRPSICEFSFPWMTSMWKSSSQLCYTKNVRAFNHVKTIERIFFNPYHTHYLQRHEFLSLYKHVVPQIFYGSQQTLRSSNWSTITQNLASQRVYALLKIPGNLWCWEQNLMRDSFQVILTQFSIIVFKRPETYPKSIYS